MRVAVRSTFLESNLVMALVGAAYFRYYVGFFSNGSHCHLAPTRPDRCDPPGEGVERILRGNTHRARLALPRKGTGNQGAQTHPPRAEKRHLPQANHRRGGSGRPAGVETSEAFLRAVAAEAHLALGARASDATALPAIGGGRPEHWLPRQRTQRLDLLRLRAGERAIADGGGGRLRYSHLQPRTAGAALLSGGASESGLRLLQGVLRPLRRQAERTRHAPDAHASDSLSEKHSRFAPL